MRVAPEEIELIKARIRGHLGEAASVWLFGSRVDDRRRGGDVDLYVEAPPHPLMAEVRCKIDLEETLDLPVDLVVRRPGDASPIANIARNEGVRL